jgi:hypothetical protein
LLEIERDKKKQKELIKNNLEFLKRNYNKEMMFNQFLDIYLNN